MAPELFDMMNFDTRMRRSYDHALHTHVLIVKDGDEPVGYAFSTISNVEQEDLGIPAWAPNQGRKAVKAFTLIG